METTIAVIGVIVRKNADIARLNEVICSCDRFIVGRMGIPCDHKGMRVISLVVEATQKEIGVFAEELAAINGIAANYVYA